MAHNTVSCGCEIHTSGHLLNIKMDVLRTQIGYGRRTEDKTGLCFRLTNHTCLLRSFLVLVLRA